MGAKANEGKRHIERCLEELKICRPWAFGHTGGTHQEVRFVHHGRAVRFIFPSSHSCHRALKNAKASLRRLVRSAEGEAIPARPENGSVLDARGVLPREPHHVGAGRARPESYSQAVAKAWIAEVGPRLCLDPNS